MATKSNVVTIKNETGSPFKIEKGIPLPDQTFRLRNGKTAALRAMAIGDSFSVSSSEDRGAVFSCATKAGVKITTRREGDGYRIWKLS